MSPDVGTGLELPEFTPSFRIANPIFYFHHIVDPDEATLTVEVLGPNLGFTFNHPRVKEFTSRSKIDDLLKKKTVGFLSIIRGQQNHILAWSESGHGLGHRGDFLDAPHDGPAIPNADWTKRAIHLANLLGLNFATPFDNPGRRRATEEEKVARRGVYQGGHVEVKLVTYAIYALLDWFEIIPKSCKNWNNVTKQHLERLRYVSWEDGSRPAIEIYFSRKNCHRCGRFARALEEITGIPISLCWKERFVQIEYPKMKMDSASLHRRRALAMEAEATVMDGQVVIELDDPSDLEYDDDGYGEEEECGDVMMAIDLTVDPAAVDLTGLCDESGSMEPVDLTSDPVPTTPGSTATNEVDDYVSGLAYCVGQFGQSATPARNAIVDLARLMQNRQRLREPANVRKPIPASVVTEPPDFFLGRPNPLIRSMVTAREFRPLPQTATAVRELSIQPMSPPLSPHPSDIHFDQAPSEDSSSSCESIPSALPIQTPPPSEQRIWRTGRRVAVETPSKPPRNPFPPYTYNPKIVENAVPQEDDMMVGWLDAPSPF